jgi:galactonate dehydratase
MSEKPSPGDLGLSRREMLAAGGSVAAAGFLLAQNAVGADAPGNQVADRGSDIKLTAIRTFPTGPKTYIRLESNKNVTGWGEVTGSEPKVSAVLAESLFELLDGENPTRIEYLWQKLYRAHRDIRGGAIITHVIAALDMALWDLTGKLWGVPVYRLLGGPCRDKIRMYPTPKAQKAGTGGPHPLSGDPRDIKQLVSMVENARKQVGPDGCVMFDAHCAIPPATLIQFANAIEPYDILFLEEPCVPGNIDAFMRLKQQIRIPMAAGERDRTIWEMLPYLTNRCLDVLQPDVVHTGGISQVKKIATLAEAFFVPLAPHNTCSELGLTASLHAAATVPFLLIHEGYLDGHIMPPGVARKNWEVDKDGYAALPQGPGLGVEMDEAAMAKVAADPKKKYKWPSAKFPDGSIRDY